MSDLQKVSTAVMVQVEEQLENDSRFTDVKDKRVKCQRWIDYYLSGGARPSETNQQKALNELIVTAIYELTSLGGEFANVNFNKSRLTAAKARIREAQIWRVMHAPSQGKHRRGKK